MVDSTTHGPVAERANADSARAFNRPVHGARGLFALFVLVFHVVNSGLPTWGWAASSWPHYLLRSTEYGVELFFCISGFVIAGTLRRARSPLAFIEDRAIRIYPVLWTSVLAIVALALATGLHGVGDPAELLWRVPVNMLALPGVFPIDNIHPAAWSLSYELTFYASCAATWGLRRRIGDRALWLAIPLGMVALAFYPRAAFLAAGMLVAELIRPNGVVARLAKAPLVWLLVFLVAWHAIQVASPVPMIRMTVFDWAGDRRLPLAIVGFVAATLAFTGIAAGNGLLGRVLVLRPLQYCGTISYSLYLWHPIVMSGVKAAMVRFGVVDASGAAAQLVFLVLAAPPAFVVADISQRVLERGTSLWLRKRLHHRRPLVVAATS